MFTFLINGFSTAKREVPGSNLSGPSIKMSRLHLHLFFLFLILILIYRDRNINIMSEARYRYYKKNQYFSLPLWHSAHCQHVITARSNKVRYTCCFTEISEPLAHLFGARITERVWSGHVVVPIIWGYRGRRRVNLFAPATVHKLLSAECSVYVVQKFPPASSSPIPYSIR